MEWGRGRQMVVELVGVGSQAAAAPRSRARSHGERAPTKIQAGPCSPPQSCLHLVPPSATPSSQLLPPPWLSLLTPQNVPTESKTPRRTPQHSNPPPHTSPASSPAPALPPSHHMQAAAMAGPLLSAEPEIWRAWGGVLHLREMVPACWLKTCPTCWVSNPKTPQVLWTPRGNFLWWKWDTE